MNEVTELVPAGKGKLGVVLDGKTAFVLYKTELRRLGIAEGTVLSEEELKAILKDILYPRAVNRLLYLLGSRDMTRSELYDKLKDGKYPPEVCDMAIKKMEEYGYVNDSSYARRYVECYIERKSVGRIRAELYKKGISRELADEAIADCDSTDRRQDRERLLIKELLEKRHYDPAVKDEREKQKHFAYLFRRGFKSEDIMAVMFDLT
ncbi:MAG: regulatory protein RecX [Lachnospiraceae bacterium]|nr:regulatory protein RecX [Lachnospiraceae bacterium]